MKPFNTLPTKYFDDIYDKHDDPWFFQTSEYEKGKFQATVDALTKPGYDNAFEIGCSIGVLTEKLAPRCKRLLSVDVSSSPIENARIRLSGYPQVRFQRMIVPNEFPGEMFDLVVMSEVGYYFSMADLLVTQHLITDHLLAGGQLLMVHWTPIVDDYPLTGDEVHEVFLKIAVEGGPLKVLFDKREEKYRINLFEKV
jgi:predicted TPR repeat methyltransferase